MNKPGCPIRAGFVLGLWLTVAGMAVAGSGPDTVPAIGLDDRTPRVQAFVHARLMLKPGTVVPDGTLLVQDGVIRAAGRKVSIPAGATVIDLAGKAIYPGFIDPWSYYGRSKGDKAPAGKSGERDARAGSHAWNRLVHPEARAAENARPDRDEAGKLRKLGFVDVLSTPAKGIWQGQSALVSLADADSLNGVLLRADVAQHAAFETAPWSSSQYPSSLMGSIALMRQTLLDAGWLAERRLWEGKHPDAPRSPSNASLQALHKLLRGGQPVFLATRDELDYARAARVADEFDLDLTLLGNGHEYRRLDWLADSKLPLILPMKLPETPKVEDPAQALDVSLAALEHWRMAPFNARLLAERKVPFAFTLHGLDKPDSDFRANLRQMIEAGLAPADALAALTVAPARMLGVADRLGTLEAGKLAHFFIADRDWLRDADARLYEVWIDGRRYALADRHVADLRGTWQLDWQGARGPASMVIEGDDKLTASAGETRFPLRQDGDRLLLFVPGKLLGQSLDHVVLAAQAHSDSLRGAARLANGTTIGLSGQRSKTPDAKPLDAWTRPALPDIDWQAWPAGAQGRHGLPPQADAVIVRNARIWTQGPQGILEQADLLVADGRIVAVGTDLDAPDDALVIDGTGLEVTPGLIDAHSHIAISRGVNEGTHAVTSEVRIGDVLDPTDMTVYRQLAGGTTTSQLLHGSANPIGGQSQIIKLRWGADAAGLKFRRAPQTIKFALGENVKQSNWGPDHTTRYPQTRMGVREIMVDSFLAAKAYGAALKAGHAADGGPLRRNLQMEALWEILQGERLVQIHSYRQDEILAFVRTAEQFGFVPTFQHVLEGYKVADAIAGLGAGASTFSDWWAYKMEVYDAIPWNGAIMAGQGVNVSFNSDDGELARRMNTEAAKAVKYGKLSPADALDFVTINPARQLHIDQYVGSLEPGKDADFVLWTGSPLSPLSRVAQTWVDGRKYFDRDADRAANQAIAAERQRLIGKALPERVKALAAHDEAPAADTPPAAGGPEPQDLDALFCARLGERDIYHDNGDVAACAEGEAHQ